MVVFPGCAQNSLVSPCEAEYEHLQQWMAAKLAAGGGEAMLDVGIGAGNRLLHNSYRVGVERVDTQQCKLFSTFVKSVCDLDAVAFLDFLHVKLVVFS